MFDNWLNQTEENRSRLEKAYQELVLQRYNDNNSFWQTVLMWLNAAYLAGKNEPLNLVNSLKNEIKIQRKEIAGLREAQRTLLDKDQVPELGWKE